MLRTAGAAVLMVLFGVAGATAQQKPVSPAEKPRQTAPSRTETAPETQEETPPPYEPQTLRLAEIMGSLAFLTSLCGAPQQDLWRAKAQAFLDAEAPSPARRARFAGAYNRGFEGYRLTYRRCTDNARLSIDRLMGDGASLTRDLAGRFGGG